MKIGVYDSGVGGITVLNELRSRFPHADFLYFGDTANVPYGTKSPRQIKLLARAAADWLHNQSIDALVVACNTASCIAIDEIRTAMVGKMVFGVVEAGVSTAVSTARQHGFDSVLVVGTRATIRSHVYESLIGEIASDHPLIVIEKECPLLVPMIEEGWIDHPILHETVAEYLKPFVSTERGAVLLACTHYPWIRESFQRALPRWEIVDSASAIGELLSQQDGLKNTKAGKPGSIQWHFTDPDSVPEFIGVDVSAFNRIS